MSHVIRILPHAVTLAPLLTPPSMPSSSRVEDTYESQNDQRLDDLHSKIRTIRGITTDIHNDVEAQNLLLDESNDRFSSFRTTLSQTSRRAQHAFGIGTGSLKPWRIAMLLVGLFITFWISSKIIGWWWSEPIPTPPA